MPNNILGKKSWISAVLSFLLLVTTMLPFGASVVSAAGGLSLNGIDLTTNSVTNPDIYYSSAITIEGTYGLDITGDNLRYSVTTLSGNEPNNTSSIKPSLDTATRTFTFSNIELTAGVNKIAFYEKNGDITTDLLTYYVQYNNTPLFSDLKLNSVFLESDPTIVEVTSTNNLTLALSGKALNADTVKATNKTTGETFSDDVNSSGNFSIDLESQIGLNEIDITAFSQNKEVALVNRNILVIPKSSVQGVSDQFYGVTVDEMEDTNNDSPATTTDDVSKDQTEIEIIPPSTTELVETDANSDYFEIKGNLLIKVQSGATILDSTVTDTAAPDAPTVNAVDSGDSTVTGTAEAGTTITVKKGTTTLNTGTVTAAADGSYTVTISATQPAGTTLSVTATDATGNISSATTTTVIASDTSAPNAPGVDTPVYDNDITVTGTAEASSLITVKEGVATLGSATADGNGSYVVAISAAQAVGDTLSVTATDTALNVSSATSVTVADSATNPDIPKEPTVSPVNSSTTTVTGEAQDGSTVKVKSGATVLGQQALSGTTSYSITIAAQTAGTTLSVTATDNEGEGSATTITVTPADTTAPDAPTVNAIDNSDTSVTGTVETSGTPEVNATVTVKIGATVLGTDVTDGAGGFSVPIAARNVGDRLSVTATDAAGNVSSATNVTVTPKNSFAVTLDNLSDSAEADISATITEVKPITDSGISSDYKLYSISATVDDGDLDSGDTYEMEVTYETQTVDSTTQTNVVTQSTVANYGYQFVYTSSTEPRFGAVTDVSDSSVTKTIKTDGSTNIVSVLPAKVKIATSSMTPLTTGNFQVFYNNSLTPLTLNTDYALTFSGSDMTIEFLKLPSNETTVNVKYTPASKEISFKLKPEVVPSLLFYYKSSGTDKVIDSTLEITDPDIDDFVVDSSLFRGNIYNYKLTSTNMTVTLNGDLANPLVYTITDTDTTDNIVPFTIAKSEFLSGTSWNLNQGANTLVFKLEDEPNVKFTYSIVYNTEKTPKIQDVTLKVVQDGDDVELTKSSSDTAYQTSALFLSELSFGVANVDTDAKVTVKKDGNVIAKYTLTDESGDWTFDSTNSDYKSARDAAITGNTSDLGPIFDDSTFSEAKNIINKFTFTADMTSREYGNELVEELDGNMGLDSEELENRLKLFPLTLAKGGTTSYEIEIVQGSVATRQTISISQETQAWTIISPTKSDSAAYYTVNTNSVPIRIFAENATKVIFGKTEVEAFNTDDPDFEYDEDTGKLLPETYYVFESNVSLKAGLNKIKFTVQFGSNSQNGEIQIYNVNSSVAGAENMQTLGKKVSFSLFDKAFELKFPSGTVLLAPQSNRVGSEVNPPATDIFTDVPLYFGIADRSNGRVLLEDNGLEDDMEDLLRISSEFNYASPLYYVDAGNSEPGSGDGDEDRQPGGRDPYFDGTVNNQKMDPFIERWKDNLVPSKEGTVTVKYDSAIVNAANNILTVFYNNGDEWTNIGGVVNTSKKSITVPFKGFGYYMVMKQRESFSDVITHDFARDAIETLYAKGIMNDAPGSGFGTELKISRGEFATMIVKALDLPINAGPYSDNNENNPTEPTFTDVSPSDDDWDYQYKYIETAARAGIVRGKETRAFFPDDPLTREEAAIIMARALNLKLATPETSALSLGKMFTDGQLTGYYAAPSVLAIAKSKIMNGEVNDPTVKKPTYRFNPKGDLTRAEMAVITIRIMVQLKKLPKQ